MPMVYCKILRRQVDGGYCAFICELPETDKKIIYNPFRGIFAECIHSKNTSKTVTKTITTVIKKSESENPENNLKIPQSAILKLVSVLEGEE
ncbi:MAG: hypothetical protein ACUVXA_00195 [Candidatus Jordarchaeum sp.]|uniref:hypothetical protein n=1 Tax=Candidatus Jordarchaeum sp. TaxID=2823881 RepID=UPI00404AD3D0